VNQSGSRSDQLDCDWHKGPSEVVLSIILQGTLSRRQAEFGVQSFFEWSFGVRLGAERRAFPRLAEFNVVRQGGIASQMRAPCTRVLIFVESRGPPRRAPTCKARL
jgi:hypothetical protein